MASTKVYVIRTFERTQPKAVRSLSFQVQQLRPHSEISASLVPSSQGASINDVRDPLPYRVRKYTQPTLLRLLTTSALEGDPPPPSVRTS